MGIKCSQENNDIRIGAQVEFKYNGISTTIHCYENDSMSKIYSKFITKTNLNEKDIYYIYDGIDSSKFDKSLTFNQMANSLDKSRKKMNILVIDKENSNNDIKLIRAKNVICPKCKENIKLKIEDDYKISLFECKNNHKINDILLSEFENTQMINLKNIKCDICKERNKADTYNNEFFKCYECNNNICPLCKINHNKKHNIYDYDKSHIICGKHNESFTNYCKNCKINICTLCLSEHSTHEKILLADLLPDKVQYMRKFNEFKDAVTLFNNIINNIIAELNSMKENLSLNYKLREYLMSNYDEKERNYEILFNINELVKNNDNMINIIYSVDRIKNTKDKIIKLFDIYKYKKIFSNEIKMIVGVNTNGENINLKSLIYGLLNQYNGREIYINDKPYHYYDKNPLIPQNDGSYNVLYNLKYPITNCCRMFDASNRGNYINYNNSYVINYHKYYIKNLYLNFDTRNVTDMSYMFYKWNAETIDLSKLITKEVTNMSYMFAYSTVKNLDISGFDTKNVIDMSHMFEDCRNLTNVNLSKCDFSNVKNMSQMFCGCENLTDVNLSNFDFSNVTNISGMFCGCKNLTNVDSSGFGFSNVTNMRYLFCGCAKLESVDLSKCDFSNVKNMSQMFFYCENLTNVNLSNFDFSNVTNMSQMFCGCAKLESVDLSKCDFSNVIDMYSMFYNCDSLKYVDLSSFKDNNIVNAQDMFGNCKQRIKIKLKKEFSSNLLSQITNTNIEFIFVNDQN